MARSISRCFELGLSRLSLGIEVARSAHLCSGSEHAKPIQFRIMEPIRVLQVAVIVLTLPVVLGVIGFVGVNLIGRGISDPTAVGVWQPQPPC